MLVAGYRATEYDVLVVGGGHAGCDAALEAILGYLEKIELQKDA